MINAVVFDVGETLVDETRQHGQWADWLGVPRHTFSAVFGGMVATGREFRDALTLFRPDFDLATERRRRAEAGSIDEFTEADLYPAGPRGRAAHRLPAPGPVGLPLGRPSRPGRQRRLAGRLAG